MIFKILLLIASMASADNTKTVFNPFSGKLDFITNLSSNTNVYYGDGSHLTGIPSTAALAAYLPLAGGVVTGPVSFSGAGVISVTANQFAFSAAAAGYPTTGLFFNVAATYDFTNLIGVPFVVFNAVGGQSYIATPLAVNTTAGFAGESLTVKGPSNSCGSFIAVFANSDLSHFSTMNGCGQFGIDTLSASYTMDVNGGARIMGLEIVTGTVTIQGNQLSVGGSSFTVVGGSATVAYNLSAATLNSSGNATIGGTLTVTSDAQIGLTASVLGNRFTVGTSSFVVSGGSVTVAYRIQASSPVFTNPLGASSGGTGLQGVAAKTIIYGSGTDAMSTVAVGKNTFLTGNGSNIPTFIDLLGTTNEITITKNLSDWTISTPQTIGTGSSPQFAGLTLTGNYNGTTAALSGNSFTVGTSTLVVSAGRVGIGTASPTSLFQVGGGTFAINAAGQMTTAGASPVVSACGVSPSMNTGSNFIGGKVTTGTGVFSSCTLTWAAAYTGNSVSCQCSDETSALTFNIKCTASNTTLIISGGTITPGDVFSYRCSGF